MLDLIVSHYVFRNFPDSPEGEMTDIKSALVSGRMLKEVGEELGIGRFLKLSKGERNAIREQREGKWILAQVIEAIIGGIYLDRGLGGAELFVLEHIIPKVQKAIAEMWYHDSKRLLQEIAQERLDITPHYQTMGHSCPDDKKVWSIGVFLGEERVGMGEGQDKQDAEREAARQALAKKFGITVSKFKS